MRNRSENKITIVMIRHGAAKSNLEHRYLGKTDEGLCEKGREELLQYQREQYYPPVDHLFVSPMKRCIQTAEILYPNRQPVLVEEWTEMDFGAFEGKNYRELSGDTRYQAWIDCGGTCPFPEGESREAFILRCEKGFQRMLDCIRETERRQKGDKLQETLGMIVHGGTIMALLSRYGGGDYFDYQAANARGYLCTGFCSEDGIYLTDIERL